MKKLVNFLLVLTLACVTTLSVVACGGSATDGESGEVDPATGNTIVKILFHVDEKSTEGQAYKKRIEAFNAAYKDKNIKASATYKARSAGAAGYETELLNNQV